MPIPVSLHDVVDELEILMDEGTAYLNSRTGEIYSVTDDEDRRAEDDPDSEEELHEWQREALAKAREVLNSDDWLPLPTKFDIHEYKIMEEFSRSVDDLKLREKLLNFIRGRGASRYFKDTLYRHGVEDDWFRYRREALEKIAIEWLEEHGIAFHRRRNES